MTDIPRRMLTEEDAEDLLAIWDKCVTLAARMARYPDRDMDLHDALMEMARQAQRYVNTPLRIPEVGEVAGFLEKAGRR